MLRVAVLGAGRIGSIHAANVVANTSSKLVAIADPIGDAARNLAERLDCEASLDPIATIERDDIDAVIIGTPTDTHVSLMLHAVSRGKAVLCEKPIDLDIVKVDAAVADINRLGGRVMLAFNRRFDPSAAALRRAIDAGEVGNVHQVIITSRDPGLAPREYLAHSGGIFRDMTIHDFDMARFFLREEPIEVMAFGSRLIDPTLEEFGDFDTVMVQLRTASGKQCHINCSRQAVYGYDQRFEIFGSAGQVLNDNLRSTTIRRWTRSATEVREPLMNFFLERYADAYRLEFEAFAKAVRGNGPMPVTVQDGRQALRLADCALESVLTGHAVKV
ncbi:Inositol 2-dehydrogenase [Beijerinckia indica subsp. indica ATCC 9039]|uniref:Inositol 2-dehydrogenase n=2 Tax=Beijerinckia TaxID=532 RepID=B2IKB6_BEII9|nr:Inositol 2-dehydrogenase [Beijerinckia indica subsp. indica ATCC 9039]